MILSVNNVDLTPYVNSLKVNYEVLVSNDSGRNANGDTVVDIVNRKTKLNVGFRYTDETEMKTILSAVQPYVVSVTFLDPKTNLTSTITAYTGTVSPEYYTVSSRTLCKSFTINFIEL